MIQKNDYDRFARVYSDDAESNAYNALYERPESLRLMDDVAGLRVLDAGCGSGAHAAALIARGAIVTGIDKSSGMLALARERLGSGVTLREADLAAPLPFDDGAFDRVLSALALHYIEDWRGPLGEFRRVLVPGGKLVISTHHPFCDHLLAGGQDYFATFQLDDRWEKAGEIMEMRYWRRPLSAMAQAFTAAGFIIDAITEPLPLPEARERFPADYQRLSTQPQFLFFAAHRADAADLP
ncbi:MAG TPA: class I SAM-dependent methyltransferase [Stellaceae bacterium]|jgi:ubiquinone/menaquinone biosynthesis C-methylase UbiE|nr:class I SAM-dependent methyltransferase [Stellaceae bacterium]